MTERRELEPWEKTLLRTRQQRLNYRGRRHQACTAADTLHEVIAHLGEEDGSQLPPHDHLLPPAPSDAIKRELQNTVANLLRLILLHNDGEVSQQTLRGF